MAMPPYYPGNALAATHKPQETSAVAMAARAPRDHAAPERRAVRRQEPARGERVQTRLLDRDVRRVQHAKVMHEIDREPSLYAFRDAFDGAAQRLPRARHLAMLDLEPVAQLAHAVALARLDAARLEHRQERVLVGGGDLERAGEEGDERRGRPARPGIHAADLEVGRKQPDRGELALDTPMETEQRLNRIVETGRQVVEIHGAKRMRRM